MGKGSNKQGNSRGKTSKNQRKEQVERKRDERSHRNSIKKGKKANGFEDGTYKSFRNQLEAQGLKLKDVIGDGNCLFRALADQLDGDQNMHWKHRKDAVAYMKEHKDDFIPFIEESVTFEKYLQNLASAGTYGGNDSIVAFARKNNTDIIIHQLNNPTFIVEGSQNEKRRKVLHLAYHDFEHYSSVRRGADPGTGPAYPFHNVQDTIPNELSENELSENVSTVCEEIVDLDDPEKDAGIVDIDSTEKNEDNNTQRSEPFITEAVEQIKHDSGCYDTEYIRTTFIDNSFDTDATLSYLLQTMSINVENSPVNNKTTKDNAEEKTYNALKEKANENEEKGEDCYCSQNEEDEEEAKYLSHEKNSKQNKNKGKENKQKQSTKKPTNRQRKELAKQARKKRRQESRKDSHSSDTAADENKPPVPSNAPLNIQSINI